MGGGARHNANAENNAEVAAAPPPPPDAPVNDAGEIHDRIADDGNNNDNGEFDKKY